MSLRDGLMFRDESEERQGIGGLAVITWGVVRAWQCMRHGEEQELWHERPLSPGSDPYWPCGYEHILYNIRTIIIFIN